MKKALITKIVIFLIFVFIFPVYGESLNIDFSKKIDDVFSKFNTVGGSYVVYYKGEKVYSHNYGHSYRINSELVDNSTKFRVASISKMVTAVGVMQLVEKGLINLDSEIGDILGYKIRNPYYSDYPITIRMLLCHTSSIQDTARSAHNRGTIKQMLGPNRVNDNSFIKQKPGSKYQYSNFAFGLLGSIIEKVTGVSVDDYMRNNVFKPMDIDASYYAKNLKDKNIAARYYNDTCVATVEYYINEEKENKYDPERNYSTVIGNLWISSDDLSKILCMLSGNGFFNNSQILKKSTVENMRKPQKGEFYITADTPYCLGMEMKDNIIEGIKLLGHQGLYYSSYCDAFFDYNNMLTMVLLNNGIKVVRIDGTNSMARELFMLTYKYLIQLPDNPYLVVN
ncbi:MAG: beta-lactamase family protein [Christensenellaceae bacterium]|nr:beta-lactamase family protein [Christensenellaceae bacterium]